MQLSLGICVITLRPSCITLLKKKGNSESIQVYVSSSNILSTLKACEHALRWSNFNIAVLPFGGHVMTRSRGTGSGLSVLLEPVPGIGPEPQAQSLADERDL